MTRSSLYIAIASVFVIAETALPVVAQFQWPPDAPTSAPLAPKPSLSSENAPTAPGKSKSDSAPAPSGPVIVGSWSGQLTQVGGQSPYKMDLSINAKGGATKYPDLKCDGKLIRSGASKSYVFYIEVIGNGSSKKGGRCPDGTITVAKSGEDLALVWFGNPEGNMIVAYGTLSKK